MKRRNFITALGTLAFGVWAPDWVSDNSTNRVQVAVPHNYWTDPDAWYIIETHLDVPLRKIFFRAVKDTPPEYTRWMNMLDNKRTFGDPT